MKLKLDANLGARGARVLRAAGHDVCTAERQGLACAPDPLLLEACRRDARALVALDTDFADPFRYPPASHAGIVVVRTRPRTTPSELEDALRALLAALGDTSPKGRLLVVDVGGRVREYRPFEH